MHKDGVSVSYNSLVLPVRSPTGFPAKEGREGERERWRTKISFFNSCNLVSFCTDSDSV